MTESLRGPLQCPHCHSQLEQATSFCPECRFPLLLIAGKYRLNKELASGGFGTVYLAHHVELTKQTERVIKILKPELLETDESRLRFRREVQVTSALSQKNDHIVRIYDDFGLAPHLGFFYVMEYLEGVTLKRWLRSQGYCTPASALHIFRQLCLAMGEAHREGIVHRDLKPHNIMLIKRYKEEHFVKVIDFGIAKQMEGTQNPALTQGLLGTPSYMSPEQCQGRDIDARSDIYAMGVVLYELLVGTTPFQAKNRDPISLFQAHAREAPTPLRERRPEADLPVGLDRAVLRSLAKDPEDRYADVESFWDAVAPFEKVGETLSFVGPGGPVRGAEAALPSGEEPPLAAPLQEDATTPDPVVRPAPSDEAAVPRGAQGRPGYGTLSAPMPKRSPSRFWPLVAVGLGVALAVALAFVWRSGQSTPPKDAGSRPVARKTQEPPAARRREQAPRSRPKMANFVLPGTPCKESTASCFPGDQASAGIGACKIGLSTCVQGKWGPCVGSVAPQPEVCNGKDDDCNGKIDDLEQLGKACVLRRYACRSKGRWSCHQGKLICRGRKAGASQLWLTLHPASISFTLRLGGRKRRIRGRYCVPKSASAWLRLEHGQFDTCSFQLRSPRSPLKLWMKRKRAGDSLSRRRSYCLRP